MKRTLIAALVVAQTACVAVPSTQSNPVVGDAIVGSNADAPICVVVPGDPSFEGHVYIGGGRLVGDRVGFFLKKADKPFRQVASGGDTSALCAEKGTELILSPEILAYEDRATGWSGRPDRIEVRLTLSSSLAADKKRSVFYEAKSNVVASGLTEWGNANPTALLGSDFGAAIERLLAPQ